MYYCKWKLDATIKIWDVEKGESISTLIKHSDYVKSLACLNCTIDDCTIISEVEISLLEFGILRRMFVWEFLMGMDGCYFLDAL
jgi:WD40 repeat protein